ncbi:hypothetical protein C348_02258 [Cryptococcus neoformans Gb118]|nr:hypothetical protein C348_02258 [Cryptococcus neoformans var. grubii Gb118]
MLPLPSSTQLKPKPSPPPRRRFLFLLPFVAASTYLLYLVLHYCSSIPPHHRYNTALHYAPPWLHPAIGHLVPHPGGPSGPPRIIPGLRSARPMEEWDVPLLTNPSYAPDPSDTSNAILTSPALLMLHIFSTPTPESRARRSLIRSTASPLLFIPPQYRHLVELKFILGRPTPIVGSSSASPLWNETEEQMVDAEDKMYGDLVRLEGLEDGENLNKGKTWEWIRWVGTRERVGWWVMKCDDDTLPILPNLLPILLANRPTIPSYFGTSLGHWTGYHFYFEGMMYGFSWPVIKTLATAPVPAYERNTQRNEDAFMGELMFSLPFLHTPSSGCLPEGETVMFPRPAGAERNDIEDKDDSKNEKQIVDNTNYALPPPNPDPCTGLFRLDLGRRLGDYDHAQGQGLVTGNMEDIVGLHGLKNDEDYVKVYNQFRTQLEEGRKWEWAVPDALRV